MKVIFAMLLIAVVGFGFSLTVLADENLVPFWIKNTALWYGQGISTDTEFLNAIKFLLEENIIVVGSDSDISDCSGSAACIPGKVTKILDGDTIKVFGKSVRFALSSAPETDEIGGIEATEFIESMCPVGSSVLVDEDDMQTEGSFGRIIGVVHCNGINLNEAILDNDHGELSTVFCSKSEFSNSDWAKKYGC